MICAWPECGREFEPPTKRHKYCCERCARLAHNYRNLLIQRKKRENRVKKTGICEICKKVFIPGKGGSKTCSNACRSEYYKKYYFNVTVPRRKDDGYKSQKKKKPQVVVEEPRPLDGKVLHKAQMTVDEYNKAHGTNYSYGYYVHYIESKGV
jgi:hypothetical protein